MRCSVAGHENEFVWPYYFATRPLKAKRIQIKIGDQFVLQDKNYIRGLGSAYGVTNPFGCPFSDLDYVEILNVRSPEMAKAIGERNLNSERARDFVKQGGR
jgi:hypothetical protein